MSLVTMLHLDLTLLLHKLHRYYWFRQKLILTSLFIGLQERIYFFRTIPTIYCL